MSKSLLFVVSRYKEPVQWIDACISHGLPFLVYDKSSVPFPGSIACENVGREAETLLRYIITHYDNLPDTTVFLQGDPRGTPPMYSYDQAILEVQEIFKRRSNIGEQLQACLTCKQTASLRHVWTRKAATMYAAMFGEHETAFWYAGGAQYIIPKACILCRPLEMYQLLHKLLIKFGSQGFEASDPSMKTGIDAWTMEVMWGLIFDPTISLIPDYKERLEKESTKS